jgi:hypothetical protein
MSVFKQLAVNLQRLDLNKVCREVTEQRTDEILTLNVENQLYNRGVDNLDASLGQYSESYKKIKKKKGQRTDHVTLRDTGKFQNLFKVKAKKDEAEIYSSDKKSIWLINRYGREIFGLTDDNLQLMIDTFYKNAIMNAIKKALRP